MPIGLFGGSVGVNAASAGARPVMLTDNHIVITLTTIHIPATIYRDWLRKLFAFRYARAEPIIPAIQITKPLANGAAKRWQGYVAREGFGMTRIKNQISEKSPKMGNTHINQRYFLLVLRGLLVFGHIRGIRAGCPTLRTF
jgi:hypothetical protein